MLWDQAYWLGFAAGSETGELTDEEQDLLIEEWVGMLRMHKDE